VAGAATIWGSVALFARWSGAAPFVTVFWRVAFASAALCLYLLFRGQLGAVPRLGRPTLLRLALLGVLLAAGWSALFTAFAWTTVATAILLNYIGPVFVALFTPLATRVPFDRRIILPLMLALAGTALIVGPQALETAGSRNLFGALLALLAAVIYAVFVLATKRMLVEVPPGAAAFVQQTAAAVVLLPAVFLLPGPVGPAGWGSVAVLGIVHTGLPILLFTVGLSLIRADYAAVLSYIEPLAAVIFAALFLAEPISWYTAAGGTTVIVGGLRVARLAAVPGPATPAQPLAAAADPPPALPTTDEAHTERETP